MKPVAIVSIAGSARPFADLPIASVPVLVTGTPGAGGASIIQVRALLVGKPDGSAAYMAAGPAIAGLDTSGTYVVFAQVADNRFNPSLPDPWEHPDNADYVSEPLPERAPTSAFGSQTVLTEVFALDVPGTYQRDWAPQYEAFVAAFDGHTIAQHADTTATGAQLNQLVGGGNCDDLHTHDFGGGGGGEPATVDDIGSVRLLAEPSDADEPRVLNESLLMLSASWHYQDFESLDYVSGVDFNIPYAHMSFRIANAFLAGTIVLPHIELGSGNLYLERVTLTSDLGAVGSYEIQQCNEAQYNAGSGLVIHTITLTSGRIKDDVIEPRVLLNGKNRFLRIVPLTYPPNERGQFTLTLQVRHVA